MLDALQLLSDAQALAAAPAANVVSTNTIDLLRSNNGFDVGQPMCIEITMDTALAGTTPTITFSAISSAAENLGTDTVLATSKAYAALAAGARVIIPIPPESIVQRYIGLKYTTTAGASDLAGSFTASVKPLNFVQLDKHYADAITIN